MSPIPFIATFVATVVIAIAADLEAGLLVGLLVAIVALQLTWRQKFTQLQQQIDRLGEQLKQYTTTEPEAGAETANAAADVTETPPPAEAEPVSTQPAAITPRETVTETVTAGASEPAANTGATAAKPERKNPVDRAEDLIRKTGDAIVSYFTDGNIFVRIGLLILFFGVAFLLKYAAENSRIPLEFRFMGAAFGGLVLLVFGWRLRLRKRIYALLLQGGGIGVIYITIFAAFQLADLLPSTLTFVLLVFFAAFTVALAVMQDSRALAVYAVVGGFLAPFLASSDSGNYIGLFSYYAVLNAVVFAVAWFRAWRTLNLVGFLFTFAVFILWVVFDYRDAYLYPATGFLLLFFLMYSLIGVLYALRQPQHLVGLVDGTLVFGTPVVVSGLLMVMLRQYDYGIAAGSAAMGVYYLLLARFAWKHVGEEFRLLAEAMLAIGVVFATLAIPYALDGHWSSAAWALEAAGILWVSIRQQRLYAQCFAVALQVGSGLLFLLTKIDDVGQQAWLNPAFLGGVFIALGAFISARMLYIQQPGFKLRLLHIPFYLWAMGWWLVSVLIQIEEYVDYRHQEVALLILFTTTTLALVYLDRIRDWDWKPAAINATLLLPVLIFFGLIASFERQHVLSAPQGFYWVAALAANYWVISRLETVQWPQWVNLAQHCAYVLFVSLLLSSEVVWFFDDVIHARGEGFESLIALVPLITFHLARQRRLPAVRRLGDNLQFSLLASLTLLLTLWSLLFNLTNSGSPAPLPYLPFINPLDLLHLAFFVLLLGSLKLVRDDSRIEREQVMILVAALAFVWLTALLIRSMHHLLEIPFDLSYLLQDSRVQTAISILWTLIGMGAMLVASRQSQRPLWIIGAALVGIVLVKMFFIDLGASGTVERIVSFLVVGSLLVATGYFSPLPEKSADEAEDKGETSHA